MEARNSNHGNRLLAALPPEVHARLEPHLQRLTMERRGAVWEPNGPIERVYFPISSVVSIVALDDEGSQVEVSTVGNEGFAGLPVFLGAETTPASAFIQISGELDGLDADEFLRHATPDGPFRRLLQLYLQGFITQVSQSVACNRLHSAERRLARWLLMCRDRVREDSFPLTHEFMAQMLGVRRATVSESAQQLQERGFLKYDRGRLSVIDPAGLEAAACSCYRIVRDEFDRLLGVPVG